MGMLFGVLSGDHLLSVLLLVAAILTIPSVEFAQFRIARARERGEEPDFGFRLSAFLFGWLALLGIIALATMVLIGLFGALLLLFLLVSPIDD